MLEGVVVVVVEDLHVVSAVVKVVVLPEAHSAEKYPLLGGIWKVPLYREKALRMYSDLGNDILTFGTQRPAFS